MPTPLCLSPSFGFGDRPGLATPAHIAAVRGTKFVPILAQQSVRENVAKMANGIPLDDSDRAPWLDSLHDLISSNLKADSPGVLACSALKERYRQQLLDDNTGVQIVYLRDGYDLIWSRMENRIDHYMKSHVLQSQFDVLEEPTNALTVDI